MKIICFTDADISDFDLRQKHKYCQGRMKKYHPHHITINYLLRYYNCLKTFFPVEIN